MSKNIYGIHEFDERWSNIVRDAGREAWVLLLTEISGNYDGIKWDVPHLTPIVRLNWGYGRTGTIPRPDKYDEFASRVEQFVRNSTNINYYQIGNELSLEWEWPDGIKPSLSDYVSCYAKVYAAIKRANPNAKVTFAPPAPWNPTFEGDWVDLIPKLAKAIGFEKIDFFSFHAYTKGYELEKFDVSQKMNPPYEHREFSFQNLYEQMHAIPAELKHLEVLVTEANGDGPWSENHSGRWVQTFYHKLNEWNQKEQQKILAGILFRFNASDAKWHIDDRSLEDFKQSLQWDYRHNYSAKPPIKIEPTFPSTGKFMTVAAEAGLNLRETMVKGKILTVLVEGQTVQVHSRTNGWANVSVPNTHYTGWVSEEFLK